MRKLYFFLLILFIGGNQIMAQDSASFQFTIAGNDVTFINTSILHGDGVRKAIWSFGDGTSQFSAPLAGTQHHYNTNGVFLACIRIYKYLNSSGSDSVLTGQACREIHFQNTNTVADSCKANFIDTIPGTTVLTKIFKAIPWHNHNKKPEQVCWTFGDGRDTCIQYNPSQPNDLLVQHTYLQPGTYNVCVKIRYQGGCQSTYCRNIQVANGDPCRADYSVEPQNASPMSRKFIAVPWHVLQKRPLRICWQFGDGQDTCIFYTAAFNGPYTVNHIYSQAGSYNVCIKILYDGGCEAQKCKITTIAPPPALDSCYVKVFETAVTSSSPDRHFFVATSPGKIPEKICWYFDDGTDSCITLSNPFPPTSLTIAHHYPAPGVYHICAKVWYVGGCVAQHCREVVIRSNTNICGGYMTDSMTAVRTFFFRGYSVMNANDHAISWRWTFGDGTFANTQQATHTYAVGGNFEVCLVIKTDRGCETKICKHLIVQGNNTGQLQLSPNPVINNLHVVFSSTQSQQVTINIHNANGILVKTYTRSAVIGSNVWDFDVVGLPAGVYSVWVHSANQSANAIFFKQ